MNQSFLRVSFVDFLTTVDEGLLETDDEVGRV